MIEINTQYAPKAIGPYSQAVQAGGFVFTSGQIPVDPAGGNVVAGGIRGQARQVFANLAAVLKAAGTDFSHVVKATVFLGDLNDFAVVNEVYASQFDGCFPARSCVEVARLPKDVDIEIEMVAYVGE